jgi:hypothetical protein
MFRLQNEQNWSHLGITFREDSKSTNNLLNEMEEGEKSLRDAREISKTGMFFLIYCKES